MNDTLSQPPALPDPAQLDLFDCSSKDGEPLNSGVSPGEPAIITYHIRDPSPKSTSEILTESQKQRAAALYRKSRALASKPKHQTDEEE